MVKLIAGKKGAGKTKLLIDAIHSAEQASKGNVVAIQLGSSLNIDIYHKVRLINIEDYKIANYDEMAGFVSGLLASNYDCTDIFVDGILRIVGRDLDKVGEMPLPHYIRQCPSSAGPPAYGWVCRHPKHRSQVPKRSLHRKALRPPPASVYTARRHVPHTH